jgi:hypothetical protein
MVKSSAAESAGEAVMTAMRRVEASNVRLRHGAAVTSLTYWHGQMASIAPRSNVAGRVGKLLLRRRRKMSIIALMLR